LSAIAELRAAAELARDRAVVYARDSRSRWARQTVDHAVRLLGTIRWVEADEERQRVDDELLEQERRR